MSAGMFLMPTPTRTRNNLLNDTRTRRPNWFVHPRVPAIFNVVPTPTHTRSTVEFVHPRIPAYYYLLFSYFSKPLKLHLKCLLKILCFMIYIMREYNYYVHLLHSTHTLEHNYMDVVCDKMINWTILHWRAMYIHIIWHDSNILSRFSKNKEI